MIDMKCEKFIDEIAELLEMEDVNALNENTCFRELDEWTSLSVMSLIAFFDDEYDKRIKDVDIMKCMTVKDLYRLATE